MARFFASVNARAPRWVLDQPLEVRRFIKFAIVGGIGALVDFGVLNLLVWVFNVPKEYANMVSVSLAIVSNFTWNRLWTYPESQQHAVHTQFGKFAIVNLVGWGINQLVFLSAGNFVFDPLFSHGPLSLNLSKACAIAVVLFWNFGINRLWTYKDI